MSLQLRFTALSDVGRVRRDNQDSGYAGPHLLVVADGVGGAARGDIASSATLEVIRKLDVPPGNDPLSELAATIHLAHDRLAEIVEQHPDLDGTSTTVTAAVFDGTHLSIGHVGDSRGYLMRDGALEQLTADHTLVQSLVDEGRITEEEARVHPHRNLILRAVDGVHEPEPDLLTVPLQVGDRLLLCSDGCAGVLVDDQLAAILVRDPLEDAAAQLIRASLEAGSSDNVTVVVAEVTEDGDGGDDEGDAPALIVGAAATAPHLRLADESTGNLTDSELAALGEVGERSEEVDPEDIRYAPQPPPGARWASRIAILVVVLVLLGGGGWGAYAYSQTRYYVGEDNGNVAIFKGVELNPRFVPPLHHVYTAYGIKVSTLQNFYLRDQVVNGKTVPSLDAAKKYVAHLTCVDPASTSVAVPKPTGTPTAKKSPAKHKKADSKKATTKATTKVTKAPATTPTKSPTATPTTSPGTTAATNPGTPSDCTGSQ
ncbi:MAG: serine/threonine-protein phosphatase [Marmoricola sp.]|nr:serine/threonine-protein phosphatase [Marmoricola sp.]